MDSDFTLIRKLSRRELDCLRLASTDKTIDEIANLMNVSPRTVKGYRCQAMSKFGVRCYVAVMYRAMKMGLIE